MTDLPVPDFESMSVEAIRKRVEFAVRPYVCSSGPLADPILRRDVPWLLAEVERLRAEAALLWASGHGSRVCAQESYGDVVSCDNCGERNPYAGPVR